jgi:hypothetical protein
MTERLGPRLPRSVNIFDGPTVRAAAVAMVKALYDKPEGMLSSDLYTFVATQVDRRVPQVRQAAAMLREMGIAVVATRARNLTRWYMLPVASVRYTQWVDRVMWDFYVESVRAHRAIERNPMLREQARVLKRAAVEVGMMMARPLSQIEADLKPRPIPPAFGEMLRRGGYIASPGPRTGPKV